MRKASLVCDVCLRERGEHNPAKKTPPMRLPGVEPIRFDLCEEHTGQYRTLMALMAGQIIPVIMSTQPGTIRQGAA